MPKATEEPLTRDHAPPLKRFQACQQCRKRKLKCDAVRPACATCTKSHLVAMRSNASASTSALECTYDDQQEHATVSLPPNSKASKSKVQRLESRLDELESLLREKPQTSAPDPSLARNSSVDVTSEGHYSAHHTFSTPSGLEEMYDPGISSVTPPPFETHRPALYLPASAQPQTHNSQPTKLFADIASPPPPSDSTQSLIPTQNWEWPALLPPPEILHHLIQTFFHNVPLASRLFHRPTFLSSLAQPPSSPQFPALPLLHAICAVSSLYSALVLKAPVVDAEWGPGGVYYSQENARKKRGESFGEAHVRYARRELDEMEATGERMFECLQATIVLSWYYYSMARWVDVYITSGRSLRSAVALGLNSSSLYPPLTKSVDLAPSLVPPPQSTIEYETCINTWWCAYACERYNGSSSLFACMFEDEDITALMPVKGEDFEAGINLGTENRQTMHTPSLVTTHPPQTTDSFSLYVKLSIILSRVKAFNNRYRALNEPDVDARETVAFKTLDSQCTAFKLSFPRQMRDPLGNAKGNGALGIDPLSLATHFGSHITSMLLHYPHVDYKSPTDISAQKTLLASRAILQLVYTLSSTSFDFALLDTVVAFSWFVASRTLLHFMKARMDEGDYEEAYILRGEVEILRMALIRMAEKIPLGFRQERMVNDILEQVDDGSCSRGHSAVWHPAYQPNAKVHPGGPDFSESAHILKSPEGSTPSSGLSAVETEMEEEVPVELVAGSGDPRVRKEGVVLEDDPAGLLTSLSLADEPGNTIRQTCLEFSQM